MLHDMPVGSVFCNHGAKVRAVIEAATERILERAVQCCVAHGDPGGFLR
jgi:hypothetical protein